MRRGSGSNQQHQTRSMRIPLRTGERSCDQQWLPNRALKLGGKLISISGPPDPDFARDNGSSWFLQQVMRLLSFSIRKKAKRRRVSYSFLFMRANGEQLSKITSLIESGVLRPVLDRVFPFEARRT